jgi:hypothetical protein
MGYNAYSVCRWYWAVGQELHHLAKSNVEIIWFDERTSYYIILWMSSVARNKTRIISN